MKNITISSGRLRRLLSFPALALLCIAGLYSCDKETTTATAVQQLAITTFTPTEAAEGATVLIRGRSFPTDASQITVAFNGTPATITGTPTEGEIVTTVPQGATTGIVTVTAYGKTVSSPFAFKVNPTAPVVSTIAPDKGDISTEVTITGARFTNTSKVYFGGIEATEITFVSATSIKAKVPAGALTGKVKVTASGLEALSTADFYVKPAITSFTPDKAAEGTIIEITGTNFSTVLAENSVYFGTVAATEITEASATKLKVKVPAGAPTDKIKVVVKGMESLSTTVFTILPTITSTTNRGERGSLIIISGTSLALDAEVYYRGTLITSFEPGRSTTAIRFRVPADAIDGEITLKQGGQTLKAADFLVINCWQPYYSATINGILDGAMEANYGSRIIWGFGAIDATNNSNAMYSFDISTKNLVQLRNNDNTQTGPAQNANPPYGAINGKIFFHGGSHSWLYNIPTNSFSALSNMSYYDEASNFVYNNQLHYHSVFTSIPNGLISRFDSDPASPSFGNYTSLTSSIPGNKQSVVEVVGDTAYIIGGSSSTTGNARSIIAVNMQNFGYTTIDLSAVMTYPISRRFLHFNKNNVLYFGGGFENGMVGHSFYSFNLTTRQIKKLDNLPGSTGTTVPSLFSNGKAYLVASDGVYFCNLF